MKRYSLLLALLCGLSLCACIAHAKDDSQDKDRAAITGDYILTDTASENKDAAGIVAFMTDDYTSVDEKGVVRSHSKQEELASDKEAFAIVDKLTCHTTITGITFTKEAATVLTTIDGTVSATFKGQTINGTHHETDRDEWIKSKGVWLEKSSTTLTSKNTINGQPTP